MQRVSTSRFHELEVSNTGQHLTYDGGGEPLEAMLDPLYFLPAAGRLKVGDLIEVFWKDDGWLVRYARLRVLRVLPEGIYTDLEGQREYGRPDLEAAEPAAPPTSASREVESTFVQGVAKWQVGKKGYDIEVDGTAVAFVKNKELAHKIAAGQEPLPVAAPEPEAA